MIRRIELKVGLFLIITTVLIVSSIFYVAYKKGFFAQVYTFTLSSKSGEDLTEGMPVVFSGFTIGTVNQLTLGEDGSVIIKIKIPENHVKWIRADSTFITNKPLIGSARIVVVTKNLQSPILSSDRVPEVLNVSDINETIKKAQPLVEKVTKIAGNIEKLTTALADPGGDVNKILSHTERLTATLANKNSLLEMAVSDRESIEAIHSSLRKASAITSQVETGISQAEEILKKVDAMAAKTDEAVYGNEGTLPTVNKAVKNVLAKLEKLDTTIDNINKISGDVSASSTDLKALREEIDIAIASLGELARELEKKIPFRKAPEIVLP